MTTEPPGTPEPNHVPEPVPAPQTAQPAPAASPLGGMSGETMVMIAGIVVVGVFVIFGLIADRWNPPFSSVVVGSFAILLPLSKNPSIGSGISNATLMKIAGYWLAVAGLWDFVGDIRFVWDGPVQVVASLILAAAAAVAFVGARSIDS